MDQPQASSDISRNNLGRRLAARFCDAVPSPATILFGSVIWGLTMGMSAIGGLWLRNGLLTASPLAIFSLYFYGGALGFAPGLILVRLITPSRSRLIAFIVGTIIIALATHTATSGIYALQYRVFYAHWHADFPDIIWFFQLAFTSAGAIYIYTVDSLHYYWPFSLACFAGFGLWFARMQKPH